MRRVDAFIESVQTRIHEPEYQQTVKDAELIGFANEELESTVWPYLLSLKENWNVVKRTVPLRDAQTDIADYPMGYIPLPARAYGRTLRELKYLDQNGGLINLPYMPIEDEDMWYNVRKNGSTFPGGFYLMSDEIRLFCNPQTVRGSLEMHFTLRPLRMTEKKEEHLKIKAANWNTTYGAVFTVDLADADTLAWWNGACAEGASVLIDVMRRSGGTVARADIIAVRGVGVGVPYVNGAIPTSTDLYVADMTKDDFAQVVAMQERGFKGANGTLQSYQTPDIYIHIAGECASTPIPDEVDNWFIALTAKRVLLSISDLEGAAVIEEEARKAQQEITQVLGQRIQGEHQAVATKRGIFQYLGRSGRRF